MTAGQRIAIVGKTGAGKTTLAQQLAARLDCAYIDLDALFWEPGWKEPARDEFRERVAQVLQAERWAASGNYRFARDLIWGRADTLIWLDYPLSLVLWRLFWRTLHRIRSGEELWNGNRETWRGAFFSRDSLFAYAIKTHTRQRREFPADLSRPEYAHLTAFRFRSPREAEQWLHSISK